MHSREVVTSQLSRGISCLLSWFTDLLVYCQQKSQADQAKVVQVLRNRKEILELKDDMWHLPSRTGSEWWIMAHSLFRGSRGFCLPFVNYLVCWSIALFIINTAVNCEVCWNDVIYLLVLHTNVNLFLMKWLCCIYTFYEGRRSSECDLWFRKTMIIII